MKSILLPLAACALLGGCVAYGGPGYASYGYTDPGYVYSAPAYGYGAPVYGYGAPVYGSSTFHLDQRHARRGPLGDRDGDGIANRRDRDRDGDGVRNRADERPNNPRRY